MISYMQDGFLKMKKKRRFVCLDTETTGLRVSSGARIIDIGMVELIEKEITNRTYQSYLKSDEKLSDVVKKISNITDEMLIGKPSFSEIAEDVLEFLIKNENKEEDRAILVIHNAKFDLSFLNFHFQESMGIDLKDFQVIDTIDLIRNHIPGARLTLDSIATRYNVDLSEREHGHGALIDSKILAKVFIKLIEDGADIEEILNEKKNVFVIKKRPEVFKLRKFELNNVDNESHNQILNMIKSETW